MNQRFSRRINQVPPSFLRGIFKIIAKDDIISFAAGLPNADLFPVAAFQDATENVLKDKPKVALQYSSTEGIPELREVIAQSYKEKDGIEVDADDIIITNGSQQGLDLLGKVLIDEGDNVLVEDPTYLAAIQALSLYEPQFVGVPLTPEGIDIDALVHHIDTHNPKVLYTIPNFQNPTGYTYTNETRKKVVEILTGRDILLVEDDPYGEIRFQGERQQPFMTYTDKAVLLGSFSKIVTPGLRLGWIVARDKALCEKLQIAKQAADLHTSTFVQNVVLEYYKANDTEAHIASIAQHYKAQKDAMVSALEKYLGDTVTYTEPEGGMFIWATVPEHIDTAKLFDYAIEEKVAFVPGASFFCGKAPHNTMRLNFTCCSPKMIDEGMQRLARAIERYEE